MTDIVGALAGNSYPPGDGLWASIPSGYSALPLEDVPERLGRAESILRDTASEVEAQTQSLINALKVFLGDLAAGGALYCGIGKHASPDDDAVVTSTLVVVHQRYEGTRNPRLLLTELLTAKSEAEEHGQADLVDVVERPTLFFERVRSMPTPQFPTQPEVAEDATSSVFQLEAHIPSEDGRQLAVIEFATPFVSHGPLFRSMVVEIAASVSFGPPERHGKSSRIQQLLG